jgi:hypothetical protein
MPQSGRTLRLLASLVGASVLVACFSPSSAHAATRIDPTPPPAYLAGCSKTMSRALCACGWTRFAERYTQEEFRTMSEATFIEHAMRSLLDCSEMVDPPRSR